MWMETKSMVKPAQPEAGDVRTLTMVAPGQTVQVVEIGGGRNVVHRLAEMGIVRGAEVRVMQDCGGPLLLAVRDTRLALGRGLAHKIRVQVA